MPDLLTPQALATAGPLVLETFFKHYLPSKSREGHNKAREDLMYDEAFVLMKRTFLEIATKHPVAALQRFGLVRTPAPPWVALHRVLIPQATLEPAAEYLVAALGGEEMAYKIAGGSKWWQVRAGPGVEAEWIVMKKDWKKDPAAKSGTSTPVGGKKGKHRSGTGSEKGKGHDDEGMVGEDGGFDGSGEFRKEMDELRCMLYIHGGAYYWGSINTHRYTIWRYARKMHGRCFAVNYRKAPQYPFPCAIHDCLAAWLYLVNPPPEARHKPVDPKNIVLAGDSAGGGLVWALLQILRDTPGLELPAGAVLISPWSDLTHSFPSILKNTATDIVPPYSFIHKPSSLWPPPPPDLTAEVQDNLRTRVRDAVSRLKGGEHHAAAEAPHAPQDLKSSLVQRQTESPPELKSSSPHEGIHGSSSDKHATLHPVSDRNDDQHQADPSGEPGPNPHRADPGIAFGELKDRQQAISLEDVRQTTLTLCNAPMKLEVSDQRVCIDTQIQLYATNAQLTHPWVSPVMGYLGGLPPLLIIAGDKEVLRDEIIYAAHKAAHPEKHPLRDDVKAQLPSLQGIEERYGPTNVHLQVYDGACHDLPLFSMTKVARGAFRAIASFARYVTPSAPGSLSISRSHFGTPSGSGSRTPMHSRPVSLAADADQHILSEDTTATPPAMTPRSSDANAMSLNLDMSKLTVGTSGAALDLVDSPRTVLTPTSSDATKSHSNKAARFDNDSPDAESGIPERPGRSASQAEASGDDAGPRFGEDPADKDSKAPPGSAGHTGIYRGENPFTDHMIRERVATDGACRPLEQEDQLGALTMPADEIGTIKEGPAMRYLTGQSLWDHKYKHALKTVERHRRKNLRIAHERDVGKIRKMWDSKIQDRKNERNKRSGNDEIQEAREVVGSGEPDAGWETEREDEDDHDESSHSRSKEQKKAEKSVEEGLLDQSWSWSWALDGEAPPPSAIISRRDFGEARQLALMADRMDTAHDSPVHGLSIWVGLAAFFSNSSERSKAHDALKRAHEEKRAELAGRGTLPGESPVGKGVLERGEKKLVRVGRIFGLGRK